MVLLAAGGNSTAEAFRSHLKHSECQASQPLISCCITFVKGGNEHTEMFVKHLCFLIRMCTLSFDRSSAHAVTSVLRCYSLSDNTCELSMRLCKVFKAKHMPGHFVSAYSLGYTYQETYIIGEKEKSKVPLINHKYEVQSTSLLLSE